MKDRKDTIALLQAAKNEIDNLFESAPDGRTEAAYAVRLRCLERELDALGVPRSVFVAYGSGRHTTESFDAVCNAFDQTYQILHGFPKQGLPILPTVIREIRKCAIFLAIIGPAGPMVDIKNTRGRGAKRRGYPVSPWVIAECGIASALEKPMVLCIHREIQPHYVENLPKDYELIQYVDPKLKDEIPAIRKALRNHFVALA